MSRAQPVNRCSTWAVQPCDALRVPGALSARGLALKPSSYSADSSLEWRLVIGQAHGPGLAAMRDSGDGEALACMLESALLTQWDLAAATEGMGRLQHKPGSANFAIAIRLQGAHNHAANGLLSQLRTAGHLHVSFPSGTVCIPAVDHGSASSLRAVRVLVRGLDPLAHREGVTATLLRCAGYVPSAADVPAADHVRVVSEAAGAPKLGGVADITTVVAYVIPPEGDPLLRKLPVSFVDYADNITHVLVHGDRHPSCTAPRREAPPSAPAAPPAPAPTSLELSPVAAARSSFLARAPAAAPVVQSSSCDAFLVRGPAAFVRGPAVPPLAAPPAQASAGCSLRPVPGALGPSAASAPPGSQACGVHDGPLAASVPSAARDAPAMLPLVAHGLPDTLMEEPSGSVATSPAALPPASFGPAATPTPLGTSACRPPAGPSAVSVTRVPVAAPASLPMHAAPSLLTDTVMEDPVEPVVQPPAPPAPPMGTMLEYRARFVRGPVAASAGDSAPPEQLLRDTHMVDAPEPCAGELDVVLLPGPPAAVFGPGVAAHAAACDEVLYPISNGAAHRAADPPAPDDSDDEPSPLAPRAPPDRPCPADFGDGKGYSLGAPAARQAGRFASGPAAMQGLEDVVGRPIVPAHHVPVLGEDGSAAILPLHQLASRPSALAKFRSKDRSGIGADPLYGSWVVVPVIARALAATCPAYFESPKALTPMQCAVAVAQSARAWWFKHRDCTELDDEMVRRVDAYARSISGEVRGPRPALGQARARAQRPAAHLCAEPPASSSHPALLPRGSRETRTSARSAQRGSGGAAP